MKSIILILALAFALGLSAWALLASAHDRGATLDSLAAVAEARIERGNYLVHNVGLCIDCHSPRDDQGRFIANLHLTGSPLGFAPTVPMPWVSAAPSLVGLPAGYTPEDMVHFLMTGERPDGRGTPLPPMPPYRLNHEDARAVTAYLRSLGAGAQ